MRKKKMKKDIQNRREKIMVKSKPKKKSKKTKNNQVSPAPV